MGPPSILMGASDAINTPATAGAIMPASCVIVAFQVMALPKAGPGTLLGRKVLKAGPLKVRATLVSAMSR